MKYIISLEDFLFESKRTAKETYLDSGLISEETFNEFLDIDTTPTKKFIDTMCKFYSQGADKEEIISIFQKAIPMFLRNIIKVDIKSVKSLDEINTLVEEKQDYKTRSSIRKEARDGATLVYEDDTQKVYLIETKEASIIYGKGTKWCTSATETKNKFDDYYHKLKLTLYYILSKTRPSTDPLYKVAIVVPPNEQRDVESTWNSNDKQINFKKTLKKLGLSEDLFKYVNERRERVWGIEEFVKGTWSLNEKGEVDVDGSVYMTLQGLVNIPFKFGKVSGDFNCPNNQLTSLEFAPTSVGGYFDCSRNQLTSLEFAPTSVGGFNCSSNQLTSLEFAPTSVGGYFDCSRNQLTSLEFAPTSVGGDFNCSNNQLTSLEFAPTSVRGNFNCPNNQLTSLEFAPTSIIGYFDCSSNQLTSLEFAPTSVRGNFYCSNNQLTSLEFAPTSVGGGFYCYNQNNGYRFEKEDVESVSRVSDSIYV